MTRGSGAPRVFYALVQKRGRIDASDIFSGRMSLAAARAEQKRAREIYGERLTVAKFKRVPMVNR